MARKASGQLIPPKGGRGWAIRFRAYGKRRSVTLGKPEEGWNRERAEAELRHVLADVERGIWRAHEPEPAEAPAEVPTFHEFASEWLAANRHGWAPRTVKDYEDALTLHLLPHFARHRLDEITIEEVDRYKTKKLREFERLTREREQQAKKPPSKRRQRSISRPLAPAQINKTLKRLSQILELAEEYGYVPRNPARGRRRRVKAPAPQRTWVEPEQLLSLIEAADDYLRPCLATLAGAGTRPDEAVSLDCSAVNLATGTLRVGRAKTDAGSWREVDLPGGVVEILTEWRAFRRARPSDPLFVGPRGARQSVTGLAQRLKAAIGTANERLDALGIEPISERVTPYSLRRTYASLRFALGDDPVYVAEQMGHADAGRLAANLYAKAVKRRSKLSGVYLAEFDRALAWAALPGTSTAVEVDWAATGSESEIEQSGRSAVRSDLA
jgi:integrase